VLNITCIPKKINFFFKKFDFEKEKKGEKTEPRDVLGKWSLYNELRRDCVSL